MIANKHVIPRIEDLFNLPVDFHQFISAVPVGILIIDTERRIVYMNHAMEALCGFSLAEAAGVPCCYITRSRICIQSCPLHDLSGCHEPACLESDLINRDRSLIPVRVTMAPLCDANNHPAGYIETYEDLRHSKIFEESHSHAYSFGNLVGKSPKMETLFNILPVIAQNDSYALITGETGTGKDMVAEAIHQASSRHKGPFIKINCGALPETLLESELFGHEKGAFTGAVGNKPGRFHLAHNGTLYLTEIGDLPLSLQVKLLTFLDDKIIYPLGGTRGYEADVRVIAATHRNLEQMVREGRFREDLFYRLNVLRLHVPPLREREGDIRLLLDHFLNSYTKKFNKPIQGFSKQALNALLSYPFPGNVRELRNIVEYGVNICMGGIVDTVHLPSYLIEKDIPGRSDASRPPAHQGAAAIGPRDIIEDQSGSDWSEIEKQMIIKTLRSTGGRRRLAAERLGWARSTLWRKMKQHGIQA
jgi:PAS domain S-box-containing protein